VLKEPKSGKYYVDPSFWSWSFTEDREMATKFKTKLEAEEMLKAIKLAISTTFWDYGDIIPDVEIEDLTYYYTLAVIFNSSHDKVLLIKRNQPPLGLFNGIRGEVQQKETPSDANIREVMEETGIDLTEVPCSVYPAMNINYPDTNTVLYVYYVELQKEEQTSNLYCSKGSFHWVDTKELLNITDPRWADGSLSFFVLDALRLWGHTI